MYGFMDLCMYIYINIKSARDPVFAFSLITWNVQLPGTTWNLWLPWAAWKYFHFLLNLRSGGAMLGVPGGTFIFGCTWGQGGYLLECYPIQNDVVVPAAAFD